MNPAKSAPMLAVLTTIGLLMASISAMADTPFAIYQPTAIPVNCSTVAYSLVGIPSAPTESYGDAADHRQQPATPLCNRQSCANEPTPLLSHQSIAIAPSQYFSSIPVQRAPGDVGDGTPRSNAEAEAALDPAGGGLRFVF